MKYSLVSTCCGCRCLQEGKLADQFNKNNSSLSRLSPVSPSCGQRQPVASRGCTGLTNRPNTALPHTTGELPPRPTPQPLSTGDPLIHAICLCCLRVMMKLQRLTSASAHSTLTTLLINHVFLSSGGMTQILISNDCRMSDTTLTEEEVQVYVRYRRNGNKLMLPRCLHCDTLNVLLAGPSREREPKRNAWSKRHDFPVKRLSTVLIYTCRCGSEIVVGPVPCSSSEQVGKGGKNHLKPPK